MTNHVHLIAQSSKGDLSGTLRDFKKFTSSTIIEAIEKIRKRAEEAGCFGFLKKQEKETAEIKIFPA
jgi:hypothetical protein